MRTISGKVDSSQSISLFKAASILSNFVDTDHGASHAVRAYLRRASASFDELVLLHKDLKYAAKSGTQEQRDRPEVTDIAQEPNGEAEEQKPKKKKGKEKIGSSVVGEDLRREAEEGLGVESERKKKKEKGVIGDVEDGRVKAEEKEIGGEVEIKEEKSVIGQDLKHEAEECLGVESEKKKKHKKKKKEKGVIGDVEDNGGEIGVKAEEKEIGDEVEVKKEKSVVGQDLRHEAEESLGVESGKKKRKKRKSSEVEEDGAKDGLEEKAIGSEVEIKEEKRKKRKSSEVEEDGAKDGSEEKVSKKKRRRAES